ncbi:MAG: Y-family DNA polymerase [Rikenellaceae bacterium]
MIGLCDCNNFFVSCERLFNPALEGRPVVVMSSNDGCVIARSNEAKALGIKMAQPLFQVRELIEQNNVATISSNLQLYGDMSERVMMILREHIPHIEVYSIDEAFLDLSGFSEEELPEFGRKLSAIVKRATGIPVSIGIAPTKTLAKVAAKLCKSYAKLHGCCLMHKAEDVKKVLSRTAVGDIWGIGRQSVAMLGRYNVKSAEDFANLPMEWVKAQMGVVGLRTWRELRRESCIEIDSAPSNQQSIMVSRSFSHDITDFGELNSSVVTFASRACEKLRAQNSVASQVQLYVATNRHREGVLQHSESRFVNFVTPTDSTLEIVKAATTMLKALVRKGFGYKKAGVVLCGLSGNVGVQSSLFDEVDRSKHDALMKSVDRLNSQMGHSTVSIGGNVKGLVPTSSANRSPMYTTSWDDILVIKV